MKVRLVGRELEEIRREAAAHGLRLPPEEWRDLTRRLGRDPTLAEAFLINVSWSEHCSYKSSRKFLRRYLPPLASHVLLGPGEDAGIVSLGHWGGEEWLLVVAHESHNHPSQVLPVEGAATGIGGIVRDVYCMGADVVGVLDGLRFGDPAGPNAERVRAIARGVIQGISEYGNALGVPNLGGDLFFHEGFDDNCLVNVVAVGVMPRRRLLRSRVPKEARQTPYVLVLVGKPTDDSGLGGAAFASQVLDASEVRENRGAVQIHDPFLKRVLVEAMKEVFVRIEEEGWPAGCKDLGAGGLGGAGSELAAAGGFGAEFDLSRVPRALEEARPHEILCAETQERFVWAVPEDRAAAFCALFNERFQLGRVYPGAAAAVVGRVLQEPVFRCLFEGQTVVEIPNEILGTTPELARPTAPRPQRPRPVDPAPPQVSRPGGWEAWAKRQLSTPNAASRAPVFRFYDPEVRGEAFLRPGEAGAGVCRPLPDALLGLAVSLDGNPHYGALDPYRAGALAVFEAARNVAAAGAIPLALTDCLNFGDPTDPVCLGDFEESLRGMRDACVALGSPERPDEPLPIVSGNVSFYNHSVSGQAIPPSPVVCCYGLLEDFGRALTPAFKRGGDFLLLTGRRARAWGRPRGGPGGRVPEIDLALEAMEIRLAPRLARLGLLQACQDISDGGLFRALWEMMVGEDGPSALGAEIDLEELAATVLTRPRERLLREHELLLSESPGFLFEVDPSRAGEVLAACAGAGVACRAIGRVVEEPVFRARRGAGITFSLETAALHAGWRDGLLGITQRRPPGRATSGRRGAGSARSGGMRPPEAGR